MPNQNLEEQIKLEIIANNMITNASKGILVDINGKIIQNINPELEKIQSYLNGIQSRRKKVNIRISSNDIKAILFKPIVEMNIENKNLISGVSFFAFWWQTPQGSLLDRLNNLTIQVIRSRFNIVRNRLNGFKRNYTSSLSNIKNFIEILLEDMPTALGEESK